MKNKISQVETKLYKMENVIDEVYEEVGIDLIADLKSRIRVVTHTDPDAQAWISPFDFPPGYEYIKEFHPYCYGFFPKRNMTPSKKYPKYGNGKSGMHAHRLVYQVFKNNGNKLPSEKVCAHLCNQPFCVNIHHIILTDKRSNNEHKLTHGNMKNIKRKTNKIDATIAKKMREMYATGLFTHLQISKIYNVSRKLVTRVCLGEIWTDAGGPITKNFDRKPNNAIHPDSKKAKEIKRIRDLYAKGVSQKELADFFKCSQTSIMHIVNRTWFKDVL